MLQRPVSDELDQPTEEIKDVPKNEPDPRSILEKVEDAGNDDEPLVHPEELEKLEGGYGEADGAGAEESAEVAKLEGEGDEGGATKALLERIAALEARLSQASEEASSAAAAAPGPALAVPDLESLNILADNDDPTDFTLSTDGLNEYARRIVNVSVQAAARLIQPIIVKESSRAVAAYSYSKEFYERFPELRDKGTLVSELSAAVEAEDPGITAPKLFMEVAKRAYQKLGIPLPKDAARRPGFVNASSPQAGPVKARSGNSVQQDVLSLLKHKGKL